MFRKETKSSDIYVWLTIPGGLFIFFSFFQSFGTYPMLMFAGALLLFIYWFSRFYEKHVDDYLVMDNPVRKIRSYPGEEEQLEITLSQQGILPILNARLEITYDHVLESKLSDQTNHPHTETVEIPMTLLSFEKKNLILPVQSKHRGAGKIRTIKLSIPNLMGFSWIDLYYNRLYKQEVVVYPKLENVAGLDLLDPKNNGDQQVKHSIYEQPILQIGTRDYVSGDPFNRIHWKLTARKQQLQTKIVEKVNQLSWCFLINIKVQHGVNVFSEIEKYLEHTAYMCRYATEHQIPFEIYINVRGLKGVPYVHLPLGKGKNHYMHALELLARVNPIGITAQYDRTLQYVDRQNKPPHIIHIGMLEESHLKMFNQWMHQGYSVYSVQTSAQEAKITPLHMKGDQIYESTI
ncbi:DUF58 domain-containing protein [Tenuibacillus multivorans]|uniref:Uncharacterized conserved protein, DUF58 family, contains vWF domain n=1 Tax=Tenuibacillus multivorans TaxID=237069 RepID=A0A1H0GB47_9BACI|nr:DUF58 domain-containing protein [Tenuibacillus multivorans]GEL78805.1 hypothetical protein TMU01_30400 [Tenuibacillus multivorans]SDO04096.1 Uncharacterized conserved protein, DUF58 family, contains vWF domain [Tenuibacillus multivorans]